MPKIGGPVCPECASLELVVLETGEYCRDCDHDILYPVSPVTDAFRAGAALYMDEIDAFYLADMSDRYHYPNS